MVSYEGKNKIDYVKIGIPRDMMDEIKQIIELDKQFGFVSIQEFVRESVRRNLVYYGRKLDKENYQTRFENVQGKSM